MTAEGELKQKARDYLKTRGTLADPAVINQRLAAAFSALEQWLNTVPPEVVGRVTIRGEWTIQEIVDHLVETHRAVADELRCLLAGRRPPGAPIPAGLQSKAPLLRRWGWLRDELRRVHDDHLRLVTQEPANGAVEVRAPVVMVVNMPSGGGGFTPLHWVEELDWRAYAIVGRLHVHDHLNQAKKVLAAQ
jgi:hypothetical protein